MEITEAEKMMANLYLAAKRYSQRYISPLVLRQIYRNYCKWRHLMKYRVGWWLTRRDKMRIHDFDSCIALYLLERCFWIRYGDQKVVSHLLTILFELEGHLGKIFDFQLFSAKSRNLLEFNDDFFLVLSTWEHRILASEIVKPVDYFIEHAYKSRVLFNNVRFAEQFIIHGGESPTAHYLRYPPCAWSFIFPEMLPKLLRHGLFVTASPKDENVCKLLTGIIAFYASGRYQKIPDVILEMGNILLRGIESVNSSMLMRCQRGGNRSHSVKLVLDKVIKMDILPKLGERCRGPQELQHICRCSIRKSLYNNWQLPIGICFLPLPTRLKHYINLMLD